MRTGAIALIWVAAGAMLLAGCGSGVRSGLSPLPIVTAPGVNPPNSSPAINTRDQANKRARWTVLVYLDADNDLEPYGILNVNQMEMIGSTQDVHVLAQVDRVAGYDSSNGDWTDTRRYLITRDTSTSKINSLRLDTPALGELNMGDWHTLKDFVEWGMKESPADNYCLVIWDHGTGWQFRTQTVPQHRYIASDETSYSAMNVTEIPKALAGLGVTVVAFDACLMQQIEVAYEIKDCAAYMVASPSVEPSPGYNYYSWISRVSTSTSPAELGRIICEEYAATYPPPHRGITQSTVDLAKINELAAAADEFARILMISGGNSAGLQTARNSTLNYSTADGSPNRSYLDVLHYASLCTSVLGSSAQAAYARLNSALSAAVVAEVHNPDTANARGVGIYIPPPGAYNTTYSALQFATRTSWDEWLLAQTR